MAAWGPELATPHHTVCHTPETIKIMRFLNAYWLHQAAACAVGPGRAPQLFHSELPSDLAAKYLLN